MLTPANKPLNPEVGSLEVEDVGGVAAGDAALRASDAFSFAAFDELRELDCACDSKRAGMTLLLQGTAAGAQ